MLIEGLLIISDPTTAPTVRNWFHRLDLKTLCIEPGSPCENGYNESFNGKLRDEVQSGEIFYTP